MLIRVAGLIAIALTQLGSLHAAQVNGSSLLPQYSYGQFVKTDAAGNIYVAGSGILGLFVNKISPDGATLIYSTSFGVMPVGGQFVSVTAMAVTPDGFVYVANYFVGQLDTGSFSTITQLDPSGKVTANIPSSSYSLLFSNYVQDIATDASGNVYVTGSSGSFTSSPGAIGTSQSPGFTFKFDSTMTNLLWGVAGYGGAKIAVDSGGNVYVVGATEALLPATPGAFQTSLAKLVSPSSPTCGQTQNQIGTFPVPCPHQYVTAIDKTGTKLIYSTYLTGEFADVPAGIAVDSAGVAYVAGSTHSFNFPTTPGVLEPVYTAQAPSLQFPEYSYTNASPGAFNAVSYTPVTATGYVAALNPAGSDLVFSTFFGGSTTDLITSVALDPASQSVDLGGSATSPDLPGLEGAYRQCVPQSFIARLSLDGTAAKRTVLIPGLIAFAPGINNTAFFVGPTLAGDIDFEAADPAIACLANSTDLSITNSIAPGQLLTIFGNQLGGTPQVIAPVNNFLPTQTDGAEVVIGGIPAPLLYVSPGQINLQVPFELAPSTPANLQLMTSNAEGFSVSDSRTVDIAYSNPTVLEVPVAANDNCLGNYPAQTKTLVLNADGTVNSCVNPAKPGSIVTIFVDGFGDAVSPGVTGMLNPPDAAPLASAITLSSSNGEPLPTLVSAVAFGGAVSGFYQVKLQLPNAVAGAYLQANFAVAGYLSLDTIVIPESQ